MRAIVAACIFAVLFAAAPAAADDNFSSRPQVSERGKPLPFPRSERAQAIWDSGACWSECGSYCAWGLHACLTREAQANCLPLGDTCDRYCQRQCRTRGGPLLGFID